MRADITISLGDEHGWRASTSRTTTSPRGPPTGRSPAWPWPATCAGPPGPGVVDPSELDDSPWSGFVPSPGRPGPQHRQPRGGDHRPVTQPIAKSGRRVRSAPRSPPWSAVAGSTRWGSPTTTSATSARRGVIDTLDHCRAAGLLTVGAGADRDAADAPLQLELNGLRVAFVAATRGQPRSRRARDGPASPPCAAAGHRRPSRGSAGVDDATIVLLHAGPEYYPLPSPRLVDLTRLLRRRRRQRRDRPPSAPARWHRDPLRRAHRVRNGELPVPHVLPLQASRAGTRGTSSSSRFSSARVCGLTLLPLLPVARAADRRADVSGGGARPRRRRSRRRAAALGDAALDRARVATLLRVAAHALPRPPCSA